MKNKLLIACCCFAIIALLNACSSSASGTMQLQTYGDTDSLSALSQVHVKSTGKSKTAVSKMRNVALRETAVTLGAQAGLSARAKEIDAILEKNARHLNTVFDFSAMIMDQHVLPPVLITSENTLNLAQSDVIRLSDRTYQILKQARFVSAAPTWREYLWMAFMKPDMPDPTLLPKNKAERKIWQFYVKKGWQAGSAQANQIYQENLARLRRDYTGMALYKKLLVQHMVSKPFVARSELGVTGDPASIRINDQVLRITTLPKLTTDSQQWQPVLTDEQ